jgi:hypothetical protein
MRIHLYTIFWNEMPLLEFFFRHYEPWVERFVCFDDGSTDGGPEYLASKRNVSVRQMRYSDPQSFQASMTAIYDECWKESRDSADWVIVLDVDEFLYHPDLESYLQSCRQQGVTCIPALGFEMITDTFPAPEENLARSRTFGAPAAGYSKLGIFDPQAVKSTNFAMGSHSARLSGRIVLPERDELLLLHYKKLGLDYVLARAAAIAARRRSGDRANNWGYHYAWTREQQEERLAEQRSRLVDVMDPNAQFWRDHPERRWWRLPPEEAEVPPLSGWSRFWRRQGNSIRKRLRLS